MVIARWVPWLLALGLTWFGAGAARAGSCEGYHREAVREFEVYATKGRPTPSADEICLDDLRSEPKLAARVVKACDAIVRREPGYAPCVAWSVRYGAKALGGLDLFEAIGRLTPTCGACGGGSRPTSSRSTAAPTSARSCRPSSRLRRRVVCARR
jgi:hypothetical protein